MPDTQAYFDFLAQAIDRGAEARELEGVINPIPNDCTQRWREAGTACLEAFGLSTELAAKNHELVSRMAEI
jgi:hypothetical protein